MTTLIVVINPTWKMGTILFMIVVSLAFGSSIYSFYYIFCNIFPDDRNAETPPQITMLLKMRNKEELNKEELAIARKTTAFKLTALFTCLFVCLGAYLWNVLPAIYLDSVVTKDGITTSGVVISSSHRKNDIGERKTYMFFDQSGHQYTDYMKADNLDVGDSVNVFYSKSNPVNHKAWKKW